jgi:hypothetical protein
MKIFKDEKLIRRNAKIGQWAMLGSIASLGTGMYISIRAQQYFIWMLATLLLGFILSQIGMYFVNHWGRSPRPDEQLDAALKGLPGEFSIYHFMTPASHLLVGPAGIWVLMPYHQRGRIVYAKNRWQLKGGGLLQGYMRIFGQEGLGRPELETANEVDALKKALAKQAGQEQPPRIQAVLLFSSPDIEIEAANAPLPALPLKKVKDFIRERARERPLPATELARIKSWLPQE